MQIWPAIDLRGGKCVRLQQGDYARETVFGEDPAAMARQWADLGAEYLHLVDLDGAREGKVVNWDSLRAILSAAPSLICELGGGVRDEETIAQLLDMGIARLVIGTAALEEPDWFRAMCRSYPGKLVLGLDARDGNVATHGWIETSQLAATDVARDFAREPICAIIYTDIATDGMLAGPNVSGLEAMCAAVSIPVVASGGVTTRADVAHLARLPLAGCIIGRALYDGTLNLADALLEARQAAKNPTP